MVLPRSQSGTDRELDVEVVGAVLLDASEEQGPRALSTAECWALLRAHGVGRIGVVVEGQPLVVPLAYVVEGDAVVVRTGDGVIHDAAVGARVAFAVDHLDERDRSGWNVLVRALAVEADARTAPSTVRATRDSGLQPWAPGRREHWIRLVVHGLSGRLLLPRSLGGNLPLEGYL